MICEDNYISKSSVWKAARRIHEAGGYDDAVTLALSILLEETGYVIEDILDYGEDE